jgi:hypothetical protein
MLSMMLDVCTFSQPIARLVGLTVLMLMLMLMLMQYVELAQDVVRV